jgi:NADH:ubiquinone oxidoreductase subunit E
MSKTTILEFKAKKPDPTLSICAKHGDKPDALLEILHDLQEVVGHVPESSLPIIAKALNLSRAEVHGVVTFYHDFHTSPQKKHVITCAHCTRRETHQGQEGRDRENLLPGLVRPVTFDDGEWQGHGTG